MILSRVMRVFTEDFGGRDQVVAIVRRTFFGFTVGGLIVTLLTGIFQLMTRGMSFYMKQGWFHSKLTCVLVLIVISTLLYFELSKAAKGQLLRRGRLCALHGITGAMLVAIVFLTIFGRGLGA